MLLKTYQCICIYLQLNFFFRFFPLLMEVFVESLHVSKSLCPRVARYRRSWCSHWPRVNFKKYIYTRSRKFAHTCSYSLLHKHPWQSELWAWQGQAKLFQSWGTFLKKYVPLSMPIFEKKSHPIRPREGHKLCLVFLCNVRIT